MAVNGQYCFSLPLAFVRDGAFAALSGKARAVVVAFCAVADFQTGLCHPSVSTLARLAGVSSAAARMAIRELTAHGLVGVEQKSKGRRSNRYRLTARLREGLATHQTVAGSDANPPDSGELPARNQRVNALDFGGHHIPLTTNQIPEERGFLANVGPGLGQAWADWLEYRREQRKKLTPLTIKRQLGFLATMSEADAIVVIERSIERGWAGLFRLDGPGRRERGGVTAVDEEIFERGMAEAGLR